MSAEPDCESDAVIDVRPDAKVRLPWKKLLLGFAVFVVVLIVIAFQDEEPPSLPVFDAIDGDTDLLERPIPELAGFTVSSDIPEEILKMESGEIDWDEVRMGEFISLHEPALKALSGILERGDLWQTSEHESTPETGSSAPDFLGCSSLFFVKTLKSRALARDGQIAASLAEGLELLETAHHMEQADGTLLARFIGLRVHSMGLTAVEDSINVSGEMETYQWRSFQSRFAELEPDPERFARSFAVEYHIVKEHVEAVRQARRGNYDTGSFPIQGPLFLRPNKTCRLYGEALLANYEAARQPVLTEPTMPPAVLAVLDPANAWRTYCSTNAYGNHLLRESGLGVGSRVINKLAGLRARHRLLLVKIATQRLRIRENRLPLTLDELVPEFLETVPIDPADGAPLRHDPATGEVWSLLPHIDRVQLGCEAEADTP